MTSSFTPDELAELRPIFSSISHHTGSVGVSELFPVLKSINRSAYTEEAVLDLVKAHDANGSGRLEWAEFVEFMSSLTEDDSIAFRQSINVQPVDYHDENIDRPIVSLQPPVGLGKETVETVRPLASVPLPNSVTTTSTGSTSVSGTAHSVSGSSSLSVPPTLTPTVSPPVSRTPSPIPTLPPPQPAARQTSQPLTGGSSSGGSSSSSAVQLLSAPVLTHTVSAVSASAIDLYSSNKYFYIVLAASPSSSTSSPSSATYVLALTDPLPPTSSQANLVSRAVGGVAHATINTVGAVANVVTNTVAGVAGLDNKLKVGKMRLRLARRSGRINEKWTIGDDGLIYSAWKRDYVLGGKPCKFYEILTAPKEETATTSSTTASSRTGSVSAPSQSSASSSTVSSSCSLPLAAYGVEPSCDVKEKRGGAVTARDLQLNKGGLKGITGLICRLPSHSLSTSSINSSSSQLSTSSSTLSVSSASSASLGFTTPKQLGVLRHCCGVEECEKEKIAEGVECGFIAVNGEEEREERAIPTVDGQPPTGKAVAEERKEGGHTGSSDEGSEAEGKPEKKKKGFFHLPHLSSKKKREKKEAEEKQKAALLKEKARLEAEKEQKLQREREVEKAASSQHAPLTTAQSVSSIVRPSSPVTRMPAIANRDRFPDLHKWRIESEFVAFLYDHVYGVLWDFMSHLSFSQYQKQVQIHQRKETEQASSVVRTPIKTSVDWQWVNVATIDSGKQEMSVWRPAVPAGHVFFGDFVHAKKAAPIERVTVAAMHIAFARPKMFQKVWERKGGSGTALYCWAPLPPSDDYHGLGHICTTSHTPPEAQQIPLVVVHRSYLKFNAQSLRQQVWSEGGDHEVSFWRTPAPLSTLMVSSYVNSPPIGAYYTLLEAYEPSEPSFLSIPVTTSTGLGGLTDWQLVWDDRNTLTNRSCSFWRPKVADGVVRFGDFAVLGHDAPSVGAVTALDHPGFRRPLTYALEYKMHRSTKRCYIWRPIPADNDYAVLGFVATGSSDPPSIDCMRCVHRNLLIPYGQVEQAWLESNSDVQNMTVIGVSKYMVGVGGEDKYGEAMVWRNTSTRTFFSYKNTHRGPARPHYRLPLSRQDHQQVVQRLEEKGLEMCIGCIGLLEAVQQTIRESGWKKLGLYPRQIAVLLQAVQGCLHHVDSQVPEEKLEVSPEFLHRLSPLRAQMVCIYSTLKRHMYDTVASHEGDLEETVTLLDTLYPIIVLLPDIDTNDDLQSWRYHPRITNRQHRSVLASLFDDQIGSSLALKFFSAFPPEALTPDIDSPAARPKDATAEGGKSKITMLLEKMDQLLEDLRVVEDNTDETEIRIHFVEIYHSYFRSILRSQFKSRTMAISELLASVKWLYTYTTLVESMCGHGEVAVRMCSDFDSLIDDFMDEHDEQQKTRIVGWVGNILKNEEKNSADKDDEGFYVTTGPQDLFLNINSLYDHAVQQDLGAKALFRVAIMYAHVLLYYQECLKRYLAHLEVAEETGGGVAVAGALGTTTLAAAGGGSEFDKPTSFLLAQINNNKSYEADTEDLRSHVLDTLQELADEQLDDVDELFDDVVDGFFDMATAAVQVLIKRVLKPLLPYLSGLFMASHVQSVGYLQSNVLDPLGKSYEEMSRSINRDAFVNTFVQDSCVSILNVYVRALLTNLHKGGDKLPTILDVIEKDRQAMVGFYSDWSDHLPPDVLQRRMSVITTLQAIATHKATALQPSIDRLKTLLANDPIVTPYVALLSILDLRHDVSSQEKADLLSQFPEEQQRRDKLLKRISLSDLAPAGASVSYQLEVTIVKGEGLAVKDVTASDPFVILYLMEDPNAKHPLTMRRTQWLPQTLNPVWNVKFADFSAKDVASFKCLVFEVWDHDVLGSDFMGRAVLTLEQIRQQRLLHINVQSLSGASITSNTANSQQQQQTSAKGGPAAAQKPSEREAHDKEPVTVTLPLTTREGKKNAGADLVTGTLTVQVAYYSKPIPAQLGGHAIPPVQLAATKAASAPSLLPAKASAVPHPSMLDVTTGHIMAKLDRGETTNVASTAPAPPPLVSSTSTISASVSALTAETDDSHRTLLDRVMFRHRKKIVPRAAEEDPEIIREREKERQRKEAELEERRSEEHREVSHAAIARLTAREGKMGVERRWIAKGKSWWGGGKSAKSQLRKQRLDEEKEREKRYLELKKKQKDQECIEKGALSQAMEAARGKVLGGARKANDCSIM